jgi:hypothetical protein
MKSSKIYLIILSLILFSCVSKKLYLELKKEKSESNYYLKINGYYYTEELDYYDDSKLGTFVKYKDRLEPLLLFKDNTFKYCMGHSINAAESDIAKRHMPFTNYLKTVRKDWFNGYRSGWGHYKFKGDSIICRYFWHSARGLSVIFEQKGIVLNDSSFVLNYIKSYEEKQEGTIKPTIYKFRYYPEKPDSTNPTFEF